MNSRGFYIALEQRILLDAAGVATAVETLPDPVDNSVIAAEDAEEQQAIQGLLNAFADQPAELDPTSTTLIFVDSRVENPEQLLGNSLDRNAKIYTIEAGVDGLAYIAEVLGEQEEAVDSLHIISHGNSGELLLGSKHLTSNSLKGEDGQTLARMSEFLDYEADILFYACNVAEGEEGKRFVEKFALISGADVAASTDLTGAISLGGDAELEFAIGTIQSDSVISATSLVSYSALLGTPDAGGDATLTDTSGTELSVNEDTVTPTNVRLSIPDPLNDPTGATPTEIRLISVSGGTLSQTDGSAITLGAGGTKLGLTDLAGTPHYDFQFVPDANRDSNVTFEYAVVAADGTNSATSTGTIVIAPVNDAPVGADVALSNTDEDGATPTNETVALLFAGANFTDPDSGFGGIAVVGNTANALSEGQWEYSTDGSNYFEIGTVADDGTALVLSSATSLRFVPAADYNGNPPGLTVRVLDDTQTAYTSGSVKTTLDTSVNGDGTPIAVDTNTVSITVSPVNDAPVITEAGEFVNIQEDQSPNPGVLISTFLDGLVEDSVDGTNNFGLAITSITNPDAGGDFQYSTDGVTWVDVTSAGGVSNSSALLLPSTYFIRFNPGENLSGTAELSYKVWDESDGSAGGRLNTSGNSSVSVDAFDSAIAVTPVNDAPVLTANSLTLDEQTSQVLQPSDLTYADITGAPNEQDPEQIIYQLNTTPAKGNFQKNFGGTWVTLAGGSLFSQQDIVDGVIRYQHTGSELSANDSDTFTFTVRDGAGAELTGQVLNIIINDVNATSTVPNQTLSVNEFVNPGDVNVIDIAFNDADSNDPSAIVFTLETLPDASLGELQISDGSSFSSAAANDTFTKQDLLDGRVRYVHNGTEPVGGNASTSFTVGATDGAAGSNAVTGAVITLNIQPINDDPSLSNTPLTVGEGQSLTLNNTNIGLNDVDSANSEATFILDSNPDHGALFLNIAASGDPQNLVRLGVGSLFTQQDIDDGNLVYQHFGANPDTDSLTIDDSFNYTVRDRDGAVISSSLGINVTPDPSDDGSGSPDSDLGFGDTDADTVILPEGGSIGLTQNDLGGAGGSSYVLVTAPAFGEIELNGSPITDGAVFSDTDIPNLEYVHGGNEEFSDSLVFSVDGGGDQTLDITITPVNERPVITTPNGTDDITIAVNEHDLGAAYTGGKDLGDVDNAFLLTTAQLDGFDIDEVKDQPDSALRYEVTAQPPGGQILIWSAADSAYVELTNNEFTIQNLKDGDVAYFHNENSEPNSAQDKFTVILKDGGQLDSEPRTILIDVTNSNDAPVTRSASFVVDEGGTQDIGSVLTGKLSDSDAGDTIPSLTLFLTSLPGSGNVKNISDPLNPVTLTTSIAFTQADLDAGNIVYEHDGSEVFADSFSYKAQDDESPTPAESSASTVSIAIRPVNDDPVATVPPGIVVGDLRYENEAFDITAAMLSLSDTDNSNKQVQIRITAVTSAGNLKIGDKVLGEGSVFTLEQLEAGLLSYEHLEDSDLSDAFTYVVSDGGGGDEPARTFNIALNAINDSPELAAPETVSLLEETSVNIPGIVISDTDAGTSDLTVTLSVTNGTLSFADNMISEAVVAGENSASITVTGTVTEINAMLAQGVDVDYSANVNFVGADTLQINVNDLGGDGTSTDPSVVPNTVLSSDPDVTNIVDLDTGDANNQQVNGSVSINVLPVNDAPTILTVPGALNADEDVALAFGGFSFTDIDSGAGLVSVILAVDANDETGGTLTVTPAAGLTIETNGTSTVTVTGTMAAINGALAGNTISYQGGLNYNGADELIVTINDNGNTGVGGPLSAVSTVAINVQQVNDAPVVPDVTVSGDEDSGGSDSVNGIPVPLAATSVDLDGNDFAVITGFTVDSLPAHGDLYYAVGGSGAQQLIAGTVSLTPAEAATLKFVPDENFNSDLGLGAVSFGFTATDGDESTSATATITVDAVNDQPTITGTDAGTTYVEADGSATAGTSVAILTGTDIFDQELVAATPVPDFADAELQVQRKGSPNTNDIFTLDTTGSISLVGDGSAVQIGGTIVANITTDTGGELVVQFTSAATEADVETIANGLRFSNDADNPGTSAVIEIKFADGNSGGQGSGGIETSAGLEITIAIDNSSNDAPIGKNASFSSEEDADDTGRTRFTLSATNVLDSEPDGGSLAYVAIVGNAAAAGDGVWQYSINAGTSWTDIPVGTFETDAIVVAAGSLLQFVPTDTHYNGQPGDLTVRVIDDTYVVPGSPIDVSVNGGITAIAANATTISVTVDPVNDAPVIAGDQLTTMATESGGSIAEVALLNAGNGSIDVSDVDATHFNGGTLTVTLAKYITGDSLSLASSLDSSDPTTGIASVVFDTTDGLVITLNANATAEKVEAMLAAIRYSYTGDNPTNAGLDQTRSYSIVLNDGGQSQLPGSTDAFSQAAKKLDSNALTGTITLVNENDSPTGTADEISVNEDQLGGDGRVLVSALDIFTDSDGDSIAGIAVTANTAASGDGAWQYSTDGSNWYDIGTASDVASVLISKDSFIRFDPAENFNGIGAAPISVRVIDDSSALGTAFSDGATRETITSNTGITTDQFSVATVDISVTVPAVNDVPVFSNVGGTVSYTEKADVGGGGLGTPVLLDADASLSDVELSGADDFDGATLKFERKDGTNLSDKTKDVFSIVPVTGAGTDNITVSGSDVQIGDVGSEENVAEITTNADGVFELTFNSNANEADVEKILRQIAYANTSDTLTGTVTVEYEFSDGNSSAQGSGGEGVVVASVLVNITPSNDTPVAVVDSGSVTENSATDTVTGNALGNDTDADNDTIAVTDLDGPGGSASSGPGVNELTVEGTYGTLVLNTATGAYTYTLDNDRAATKSLDDGDMLDDVFNYEISDPSNATSTSTITITVSGANDAPVATDNTDSLNEGDTNVSGNVITDSVSDSDDDGDTLVISDLAFTGSTVTDNGSTFSIEGDYGTLVVTKASGEYVYTLNNGNSEVSGLAAGESLVDSFTYTLSDGTVTDTATLDITTNGVNDSPTGSAGNVTVEEDLADPAGVLVSSLGIFSDLDDSDTFAGIAVVGGLADANEGVWQFSSDNGENWASIVGSASGAMTISATSLIRFLPTENFSGTPAADSLSVRVIDDTYAGSFSATSSDPATIASVDFVTTPPVVGDSFADTVTSITVTVTPVNDAPVFSNVGEESNPEFTEGNGLGVLGTAVLLDANATVSDVELSNADGASSDDFAGATLTLERRGAANGEDVFSIVEGNSVTLDGTDIRVGGFSKATITSNTDGTMLITFGSGATNSDVNSILRQLAYANSSDNPSSDVIIDYTFNDQNSGALPQGAGATESVVASVTVDLIGSNDVPQANPDTASITEGDMTTAVNGSAITGAGADIDPDNDSLSITDITFPGNSKSDTDSGATFTIEGVYGTLVITKATGDYVYTLDNDRAATQALDDGQTPDEVFTYTVSDSNGESDTSTITVTVNGTNDAPEASPNTASITEDDISVGGNLILDPVADLDPDDSDLDISGVTGSGAMASSAGGELTIVGEYGTLVINEDTGVYVYTLDNGNSTVDELGVSQSITDSFTYTVTDGDASDTATLTVTINGKNDDPVANPDTGTVTEDSATTTATGNALLDATADSDVDGDGLDVTGITGPNGASTDNTTTFSIDGVYGSLTINKDTGAYTYTLDNGRTATQQLDGGDVPTEEFTYSISDGQGGGDSSTITITVEGVNDNPTTSATISNQTNVDGAAGISLNAATLAGFADVDADDTITFTATNLPPGLSISAAGLITGTIDSSASQGGSGGVYSVTVTGTDSKLATVTSEFSWTVTNPGPTATDNAGEVTEDGTVIKSGNLISDTVSDSDPDSDDLDISTVSFPSKTVVDDGTTLTIDGDYGTLVINKESGAYTYTLSNANPATDALDFGDTETDVFTYTLTDNEGGTATADLTITVNGANDAPTVATGITDTSTPSNGSASIDVSGNFADVDADDSRTFVASGLPGGLSIDLNSGEITGTPDVGTAVGGPGGDGVFPVTVTVTDANGLMVSDTFNLTVGNTPPNAEDNSASVTEDSGVVSGNLITDATADSDVDGDDLDISLIEFTGNTASDDGTTLTINGAYGTLSIDKETGAYTYTPDNGNSTVTALAPGQSLTETFTYTLDDSRATATADLVVTINGANDAPTLDLDIDDSSGSGGADYQTTFTEGLGAVPVVDADVTIADVDGVQLQSAAVTITNFQADDVLEVGTLPAGITADISGGTVTLTGAASLLDYQQALQAITFSNTSENPITVDRNVTVLVNDGDKDSNLAQVTISVVAQDDPPQAQDDTYSIGEGTTLNGSSVLLDNGNGADLDFEGSVLNVVPAGPFTTSAGGTVTIFTDGTFTYDPPSAGFVGTDTFDYTVTDGGLIDTGTVTINVNSTNSNPSAAADAASTDPGSSVSGDVLSNDSDPENDPLSVLSRQGAGSGGGLFQVNSDGDFIFSPNGDFDDLAPGESRITSFNYRVIDGNGGGDFGTITVTVTGLNTVPVADSAGYGLTAGAGPISENVSGSDPDGDALVSFNLVSSVTEGTLTFNSDGSFSFDDNGEFADLGDGESRVVSFTYTVTDENGGVSAPATVSITVVGEENITVPGPDTPDGPTDPDTPVNPDTPVDPEMPVDPTMPTDPDTGDPDNPDGPGTTPDEIDPPVFIDPTTGEIPDNGGVPGNEPGNTPGGDTPANTPTGTDGGGDPTNGPANPVPDNPTVPTTPSVDLDSGSSGSGGITQLTLTLTLQDQLVTTRGQNLFSIPANAFDNGGTAPISVEVVQADGSALPDFIVFNPGDMSFSVDGAAAAAAGVEEVIIRVTGSDSSGSSASGTFIIVIVEGDASEAQPVEQEQPVSSGNSADQGFIPSDDTVLDEVASDSVVISDESESYDVQSANTSFFDKLDVAANEDNFERKIKQLLDDIVELIS